MSSTTVSKVVAQETRDEAGIRAVGRRSYRQGISLLVTHYGLYCVTLVGALAPLPVYLNIPFGIANGIFIALLFIIGHDAAHASLVPGQRLNYWLARLAFIPCVHSLSLWRAVHNGLHHWRTNLKGVDSVWVPMSKSEYDHAHPLRRWLERIYRGPFGPIVYYYFQFWIHRILLPLAPEVRSQWKRHLPDSLFVLAAFTATLAVILMAGKSLVPERPLWSTFVIGWVLPFSVWNYLMGFTTYLNHTHPSIPWFDDEETWMSDRHKFPDTAFVRMPFNLVPLYTKVMAHPAHHRRPNVPVYALMDAQAELKESRGDCVEYTLTIENYRTVYRACKLFDFDRMCWTDFNGTPTTKSATA